MLKQKQLKNNDYIKVSWIGIEVIGGAMKPKKRKIVENFFVGQVIKQDKKYYKCKVYHSSMSLPDAVSLLKKQISSDALKTKKEKMKILAASILGSKAENQYAYLDVKKINKSEVLIYEL